MDVYILPKELSGYEHNKYYIGISSLLQKFRLTNERLEQLRNEEV